MFDRRFTSDKAGIFAILILPLALALAIAAGIAPAAAPNHEDFSAAQKNTARELLAESYVEAAHNEILTARLLLGSLRDATAAARHAQTRQLLSRTLQQANTLRDKALAACVTETAFSQVRELDADLRDLRAAVAGSGDNHGTAPPPDHSYQ